MSDNSRQWTLHYSSHSLTVQLRTLLLRHSSSYAADCSRRAKQLLLHVLLTHCSRDTLSESSDNSHQWTLYYRSHSLTVQLRTVLLRHSSSYAADCCRRTERLSLHVLLTQCSRDTLSESSYKQKKKVEGNYIPPMPGLK